MAGISWILLGQFDKLYDRIVESLSCPVPVLSPFHFPLHFLVEREEGVFNLNLPDSSSWSSSS